jgi:hypothetical protein
MPTHKPHLSIHAAVMNCVARCADSDTPALVLADFLEKLRILGWSEMDVEAVGCAVMPKLGELRAGVTGRMGHANLAAVRPLSDGSSTTSATP